MSQVIMKETAILPTIVLRGLVVFPNTLLHFDIVREKSILALENAMVNKQTVFVTAQKDVSVENPSESEIEPFGVICKINQVVKMPNDTVRVLVEGLKRARICEVLKTKPHFVTYVEEIESYQDEGTEMEHEVMRRKLMACFKEYHAFNRKINTEFAFAPETRDNTEALTDSLAHNLPLKTSDKQKLLSTLGVMERAEKLLGILVRETELARIDNEIENRVRASIDQNQKEYFLREQVKAIQEELGDKDGVEQEAAEYREKLAKLNLPEEIMEKCEKELQRFEKMNFGNPESSVIRTYLTWVCDLPWNAFTEDTLDIKKAKTVLARDHYGLEKVKERILEFLAVKQITGSMAGPILCLVGPPGVGKTSIAHSIAESMGKNYVRISLGGIRDEADIRGHRRTYIGSVPGRIITALKEAKSNNPLMLFDEIDKMASDYKGDPSAALLEVLDSEQNTKFRDHFMEVDFDLSNVFFIATANTLDTVPRPLLDRMEIIEIPGYTSEEKFHIAKKHLLPKQMEKHGLTKENISVNDGAIRSVIEHYTKEAGVRNLERKLAEILRKAARSVVEKPDEKVKVTAKNTEKFLGKHVFEHDAISHTDEVGVVTGLAWTQVGGDTLSVEVNVMPGSGKVELTGQLGDVMKESAMAAISYVRANAESLNVGEDFYKTCDIHIHVPEGATPKDGPSAGITIATAITSALSGRPVKHDVAMTGEVTIRGRVLPIGGLREKTLAAYRAGIKTVLIPKENTKDIDELETVVKENMVIKPVTDMREVLGLALS